MYLMSACLCGVNCKYNGLNNYNEKCNELFTSGKAILICPEQLGGLPTPRIPSELQGNPIDILQGKATVIDSEGTDVSDKFIRGAKEVLNIAKKLNIKKAILKDGSPSCGVHCIYDGSFSGNKIEGMGITTKILKDFSIEVLSETDLGGKTNGSI